MADLFTAEAAPQPRPQRRTSALRPKCVCLDLETSLDASPVICKLAAWRPDTDEKVVFSGSFSHAELRTALERLAAGASFVLGHNIVAHDLPILYAHFGDAVLGGLPALDTLELSPIAFPQNPYHRLVKDYKLVRDSRSDPMRDAQLCLRLFQDEHDALTRLAHERPREAACLHYLMTGGAEGALATFFMKVRRTACPTLAEVRQWLPELLAGKVCTTRLETLVANDLARDDALRPLAYVLAWLRVAGGNSVLPPWVAKRYPHTRQLIAELRDSACGRPECAYCNEHHDPHKELAHHFGLPTFRPQPAAPDGGSLQEAIVRASMRREHLLAILPTGAGKSLCYQLPALSRFWRTGSLTIVVSPLQSLMKDQVDGLVRQGIFCAAALNGLLSMPERKDVLDRLRLGDVGILLVSPEQLRNPGFRDAIRYRDVGAWVFDEAHCLSKWGHDFRPDYLYAARFIHERHGDDLPQIACFTATAKLDVIADLEGHFKDVLGIELRRFAGGHERPNLHYEVIPVRKQDKLLLIQQILASELAQRQGGAIVFTARRKSAETIAAFLRGNGWACSHFHAGLTPEVKKSVQQAFIGGDLRVIAATNAFGMGVDKPDVRLVIHAEIPGSVENYLQEAGRAGRDQRDAQCILLYDEEDVEVQFGLSARSRLSAKDIVEILRLLRRKAARSSDSEVVITPGEILADDDLDVSIAAESPDADTRVKTAIAWLERARFLKRDENHTRMFPASLRVMTLEQAQARLAGADLSESMRAKYLKIVELLMNAEPNEGISTDELMLQSGLASDECIRVLQSLERLGVVANDLQISVYLRKGIADASSKRFERVVAIERATLAALAEQAPDAADEGRLELNLRALCQRVRDDTTLDVLPDELLRLLRMLGQPFGDAGAERTRFEVRKRTRDQYRARLTCPWRELTEHTEARIAVAKSLLDHLLGRLPPAVAGADLLIEAKMGELCAALRADMSLLGVMRDEATACQRALLYLDSLGALVLDRGRAVFRSAMTIRVLPEASRRRFTKADFGPLEEHYHERNFQVHVVAEFAHRAMHKLADALQFIAAYFTLPRRDFVRMFFADRKEVLERATTAESYRRIVEDLRHPVQQHLVAARDDANGLVLAGPGSGKTRVVVHRVAYLLRVARVPADSILVLAFNRSAAHELRRRLFALVGNDAVGVTVLTYHALALRLTGTSVAEAADADARVDFDAILTQAADLLEGRARPGDEADELRERLLRGYRYVLVDEYQDIDALQYRLVSGIAGRTLADRDAKLTLLAVGDDDQNIYAFRNTNVEFIKRFCDDYSARTEFLVENYRSTGNIVECANRIIEKAPDRLKAGQPIRVNHARRDAPAGGCFAALDAVLQGRVHVLRCPPDANVQAQVVMAEVARLRALDADGDRCTVAILGRTHKVLAPLRAYCEREKIAYTLADPQARAGQPALRKTREGQRLARLLMARRTGVVNVAALARWARRLTHDGNPWTHQLLALIDECASMTTTKRMPAQQVLEALCEVEGEALRTTPSRLTLSTAHGAKGREFRHVVVLDGGWRAGAVEEERRLYYVAATRAQATLTLVEFTRNANPFTRALDASRVLVRSQAATFPAPDPNLDRQYVYLGLRDVDIGYAGRTSSQRVHEAIRGLRVGDELRLRNRELVAPGNVVVGRLAQRCELPAGEILSVTVTAIVPRSKAQVPEPEYRRLCRVDEWEIVLALVCVAPRPRSPEPLRAPKAIADSV
jgi:ATP-dependent DNA helicase RecQ